jgi:hypothetical protein
MCAARFLVEGNASLMRRVELNMVAHHGGEGDPNRAEQDRETQQGRDTRWAADGTTDCQENHIMFSLGSSTALYAG